MPSLGGWELVILAEMKGLKVDEPEPEPAPTGAFRARPGRRRCRRTAGARVAADR